MDSSGSRDGCFRGPKRQSSGWRLGKCFAESRDDADWVLTDVVPRVEWVGKRAFRTFSYWEVTTRAKREPCLQCEQWFRAILHKLT